MRRLLCTIACPLFIQVEILVGRDKGKQGIVRQIVYERNWVFVDGLNNVSTPRLF